MKTAESSEICEYGARPAEKELREFILVADGTAEKKVTDLRTSREIQLGSESR